MSGYASTQADGRRDNRHRAPGRLTIDGHAYAYMGPGQAPGTAAYFNASTGGSVLTLFYANPWIIWGHQLAFRPQNHGIASGTGGSLYMNIKCLHDPIYYMDEVFLLGPVTEGNGQMWAAGAWKCPTPTSSRY